MTICTEGPFDLRTHSLNSWYLVLGSIASVTITFSLVGNSVLALALVVLMLAYNAGGMLIGRQVIRSIREVCEKSSKELRTLLRVPASQIAIEAMKTGAGPLMKAAAAYVEGCALGAKPDLHAIVDAVLGDLKSRVSGLKLIAYVAPLLGLGFTAYGMTLLYSALGASTAEGREISDSVFEAIVALKICVVTTFCGICGQVLIGIQHAKAEDFLSELRSQIRSQISFFDLEGDSDDPDS